MTALNRRFALLALFVLLGAAVAVGFHHHGDGTAHRDCSACSHLQQFAGAAVASAPAGLTPPEPAAVLPISADLGPIPGRLPALPNARAPPA